jgi:hypothetical protein
MNAITDRIHRSWQIFRRSVFVIRQHPKLLIFPVVTGLLTFGIAIFFLAPVALALLAPHWISGSRIQAVAESIGLLRFQAGGEANFSVGPVGSAILAAIYLVNMFLATMGSVAFSSEILEALGGRPVSIRHGIALACSRWKSVLLWSLLAGLVGVIIRAVEERLAFVGRLIAGLIGLAWSVASIFAIPILVREPALSNPFTVLSQSAQTIKRTWGELLAGYVGMKGTNVLFLLGSVVFWLGATAVALALSNPWIWAVAAVIWLPILIAYSYLASVASRVYLCALYLYASEGFVAGPYDAELMNMGWKLKKGAA